MDTMTPSVHLEILQAPPIPGLRFRTYQGESDLPAMLSVINCVREFDQEGRLETLENMRNDFTPCERYDPRQDYLIAEINGEMIGYSRAERSIATANHSQMLLSVGYILPEWRRRGLGRAMLHANQRHLLATSALPPETAETVTQRFFESFATNFQPGSRALLEQEGYQPARETWVMVRPNLDNIPDLPLPEGIEVRPARPEEYRAVWEASHEAFRDVWGYTQPSDGDFETWLNGMECQPELWQIAWDGEQIAGSILNFINHEENTAFGRKRGWTEGISVRRPWRRHGLARALLARSLKIHRDKGMTETALGVDAQSAWGAHQLYLSMGYEPIRTAIIYRKEITA